MMMFAHRITLAFVIVAWIKLANAFAPMSMHPCCKVSTSSALQLVPEQGRHLVTYSQAALAQKAKESASKASNLTSDRRRNESTNGLAKARNLMTRLLHLSPANAGANSYGDEPENSVDKSEESGFVNREKTLHDRLSSFYQEISP